MPGNPNGNRRRCRTCHCLAGKDGYCKLHRPEKRTNPFRSNFKPHPTYFKEKKDFGAIKDSFGSEKQWD